MALSDDGRRALLTARTDGGRPSTPGTYKVTSVDLTDPSSPRVAWERTTGANAMALAPDASAFAFTLGNQSSYGLHEAVLVRVDGGDETKFSFHSVGSFTGIRIAPGARFVAVGDFAWMVEDLARHPPAVFDRRPLDSCAPNPRQGLFNKFTPLRGAR
jgi:hypothetical protein